MRPFPFRSFALLYLVGVTVVTTIVYSHPNTGDGRLFAFAIPMFSMFFLLGCFIWLIYDQGEDITRRRQVFGLAPGHPQYQESVVRWKYIQEVCSDPATYVDKWKVHCTDVSMHRYPNLVQLTMRDTSHDDDRRFSCEVPEAQRDAIARHLASLLQLEPWDFVFVNPGWPDI